MRFNPRIGLWRVVGTVTLLAFVYMIYLERYTTFNDGFLLFVFFFISLVFLGAESK